MLGKGVCDLRRLSGNLFLKETFEDTIATFKMKTISIKIFIIIIFNSLSVSAINYLASNYGILYEYHSNRIHSRTLPRPPKVNLVKSIPKLVPSRIEVGTSSLNAQSEDC